MKNNGWRDWRKNWKSGGAVRRAVKQPWHISFYITFIVYMVIYGVYTFYLPINLSYLCFLTLSDMIPRSRCPRIRTETYIDLHDKTLYCKSKMQMLHLALQWPNHNRMYATGWRYLAWIVYLISCPSDEKKRRKTNFISSRFPFLSFFRFEPKETKLTFRTNQKRPKLGFISAFSIYPRDKVKISLFISNFVDEPFSQNIFHDR